MGCPGASRIPALRQYFQQNHKIFRTYLSDLVDLLLPSQAFFVLHLLQSPLLKSIISSLESSFRMAIDLVGIV